MMLHRNRCESYVTLPSRFSSAVNRFLFSIIYHNLFDYQHVQQRDLIRPLALVVLTCLSLLQYPLLSILLH